MKDTASVRVDRQIPHQKYGKYFAVSRKFMVHDPQAGARVGDLIEFEECRPLSKCKRWRFIRTVKQGVGIPGAERAKQEAAVAAEAVEEPVAK